MLRFSNTGAQEILSLFIKVEDYRIFIVSFRYPVGLLHIIKTKNKGCCKHLQKSCISGNALAIEKICDFLNLFENTSILGKSMLLKH